MQYHLFILSLFFVASDRSDREESPTVPGLSYIMDENGIMWDDGDDTLPDVSDSELDRVGIRELLLW